MASNQTLKQLVTNLVTKMLRLLDAENLNEFLDSRAELFEAQRFLFLQAIEILEENGIETEAMVNDFSRAVNQTNPLDAVALESRWPDALESWINNDFSRAVNQTNPLDAVALESWPDALESWINFWQQVIGEIRNNPRMMELKEELETYYGRIITHENLMEIIEEANDLFASLPSRQDQSDIQMAEWKEKLEQILRKFLEVETALNDQHN